MVILFQNEEILKEDYTELNGKSQYYNLYRVPMSNPTVSRNYWVIY